jgi:hypothetical protein
MAAVVHDPQVRSRIGDGGDMTVIYLNDAHFDVQIGDCVRKSWSCSSTTEWWSDKDAIVIIQGFRSCLHDLCVSLKFPLLYCAWVQLNSKTKVKEIYGGESLERSQDRNKEQPWWCLMMGFNVRLSYSWHKNTSESRLEQGLLPKKAYATKHRRLRIM